MGQLTEESEITDTSLVRARREDLTRFVAALREAAHKYQFGIESRGVQVEIYDRMDNYVPGRPFAVLLVDGFEVRK